MGPKCRRTSGLISIIARHRDPFFPGLISISRVFPNRSGEVGNTPDRETVNGKEDHPPSEGSEQDGLAADAASPSPRRGDEDAHIRHGNLMPHMTAFTPRDWLAMLKTNDKGNPLPGLTLNWTVMLEHHPDARGMLALDEFSDRTMLPARSPSDPLGLVNSAACPNFQQHTLS